jgi:hypothetical protein
MVSAWPEPPSAMSAEPSAGVRDGMEVFAFGTTDTPTNRAGEEQSGVQAALNLLGRFLQRAIFREARAFLVADAVRQDPSVMFPRFGPTGGRAMNQPATIGGAGRHRETFAPLPVRLHGRGTGGDA